MRKDVRKYLFIGPSDEKNEFFKLCQQYGLIHFIDPLSRVIKDIPEDVQRLIQALKVLRRMPPMEQEENYDQFNADQLIDMILNLQHRSEKLQEEIKFLENEISRVVMLGNFSFDDIHYIEKKGKRKIQFFCAKQWLFSEENEPENLIYIVSDEGLDYYMAINDDAMVYDKMIEVKISHPLDQLKKRLTSAQSEYREVENELKKMMRYNGYLHHALIEKLNLYHLNHAQNFVQPVVEDSLFAVEGWIPSNKVQYLDQMTDSLGIYYDEIAIEPTEVIPTYLENQGLSRLGEDLVNIYDTPSATDKDPSMWVLCCFALFFAFIIGDAGYGLVYLAIALFLRYKYPNLKSTAKRVLDLFTVLCIGCVIWGTLMTSFFGIQIDLDNPLRKISLLQWLAEKKADYHIRHHDEVYKGWITKYPELKNVTNVHEFVSFIPNAKDGPVILNRLTDNVMFELALFIGIVHLIASLFRYVRRNWQNIGWVAFLVGAYLYFPSHLGTPSFLNFVGGIDLIKGGEVGFQLMLVGIGVAWILSIIRNGWTGIFEVMVLIQVFADTLSYLRLYALGLAGAIVGSTINEIASGLPLMIGGLLIVISHLINIALGTMSGVIHGLRLNFLEWYHYSFEGGGKKFQPLKLLKKE